MPPDPSSRSRSDIMSAVSREDTGPEMTLRKALWHTGLRYRVHEEVAGTTPDLVFHGSCVAVFVDGCFWHGCPDHYSAPENNADFWRDKLEKNRERDRRDNRTLREAGWTVLRFWGCEINEELEDVVEEVRSEVHESS